MLANIQNQFAQRSAGEEMHCLGNISERVKVFNEALAVIFYPEQSASATVITSTSQNTAWQDFMGHKGHKTVAQKGNKTCFDTKVVQVILPSQQVAHCLDTPVRCPVNRPSPPSCPCMRNEILEVVESAGYTSTMQLLIFVWSHTHNHRPT